MSGAETWGEKTSIKTSHPRKKKHVTGSGKKKKKPVGGHRLEDPKWGGLTSSGKFLGRIA